MNIDNHFDWYLQPAEQLQQFSCPTEITKTALNLDSLNQVTNKLLKKAKSSHHQSFDKKNNMVTKEHSVKKKNNGREENRLPEVHDPQLTQMLACLKKQ